MSQIAPDPEGLSCVADADPTGNNIPSVQLKFRFPGDSQEYESGLFAKFHGDKVEFYQRASGGGDVFALDGNSRVLINQL